MILNFRESKNFRKSKNIRKFEKAKNMIKSKMSFVVKRGNDSTSVDCLNMLKKCIDKM